jgi:hypothetical protein
VRTRDYFAEVERQSCDPSFAVVRRYAHEDRSSLINRGPIGLANDLNVARVVDYDVWQFPIKKVLHLFSDLRKGVEFASIDHLCGAKFLCQLEPRSEYIDRDD